MYRENTNTEHNANQLKLTRRGHIAAGLAVTGLAASSVLFLHDRLDAPEMDGSHIVTVEPGDTVSDIANEVDGGASYTGDVVDYIVDTNPAVFEDGTPTLGSEDLGQDLVVPESVEK